MINTKDVHKQNMEKPVLFVNITNNNLSFFTCSPTNLSEMKQEFTNSKQKLRRVIPHNILGFKIVCVYIELYNSGSRNFSRMMKFLPLFVPFPLTKVCLCVLGLKKTNCGKMTLFLKINIQQGGGGGLQPP